MLDIPKLGITIPNLGIWGAAMTASAKAMPSKQRTAGSGSSLADDG